MRLVTVLADGVPILGFVLDGAAYSFVRALEVVERATPSGAAGAQVFDAGRDAEQLRLGISDMLSFIDMGEQAWAAAARLVERFANLEGYQASLKREAELPGRWTAPIPRPRKNIFCVGRNYAEHAAERGAEAPEHPVFFTKAPTAVVGPDSEVPYPRQTEQFDFEGELAVVIGRRGRDIPRERATDYVFGYTIINDLTARDLQKRHQQWFRGKSLDGSCPMGPVLVTRDELADPAALRLETRVNGRVRQSASTAQMLFDIPTLISVLSDGMTLEPGDVIATGTPSGVGAATGEFLRPGDRVEISITGIGTLVTSISQACDG